MANVVIGKTWTAIFAILAAIGSMIYAGCNKAIELDNKLDQREAVIDSIFRNDSIQFNEIKAINRKIGRQTKLIQAATKVKRKGLWFKGWDLIFARGK